MSEEKDRQTMAAEQVHVDTGHHDGSVGEVEGIPPQLHPMPGLLERRAARRRQDRVHSALPIPARQAILASMGPTGYAASGYIPTRPNPGS